MALAAGSVTSLYIKPSQNEKYNIKTVVVSS